MGQGGQSCQKCDSGGINQPGQSLALGGLYVFETLSEECMDFGHSSAWGLFCSARPASVSQPLISLSGPGPGPPLDCVRCKSSREVFQKWFFPEELDTTAEAEAGPRAAMTSEPRLPLSVSLTDLPLVAGRVGRNSPGRGVGGGKPEPFGELCFPEASPLSH